MRYLEFSFVESGNILFNSFGKQFDIQDDFSPSTLSFSLDRRDPTNGEFNGSFVKVKIDGIEHKTYFVIGGNAVDYVTEDGIPARAYNAASIHHEFEDAPILPSAWPNPVPSGHDFQNATPGTIVKTLVARLQELGYLVNIDTSSFTGTHDSNGVTWPLMLDRSYTTGDTILSVIQGLFSEGSCDAEMDGYSLNLYVSDTLDKTLSPDDVVFRVGQNLTSGSTETDSTDFYTDIFAIGDGDAAVMKSRPDSYNILGRRRLRFSQYSGITNASLLGVMADIELDQYNHIKSEHSYAVSSDFYTPFIDYDVHNLVYLDTGDGELESIRIKQISVTQSDSDGSFSVGVTLGDLLEDADEKLKRRLDAITGANAGGGGVPSDKTDDKNPPQWPASVTISSLSYIDASTNPKVAALVDWPDVTTNSDGTPADDIDHYEVQYRTAPATPPGGTPTPITSVAYSSTTTTVDSKAYFDSFEAGTIIQVQVRTVDTSGLVSPQWTQSVATTLVRTGGTLISPSTPTVSAIFQGVKVSWNGLDSNGNTPTGEWIAVAVHVSSAGASFTPSSTTKVDTLNIIGGQLVAKVTSIPGLLPGTTYWVKLVAVGRDGGASSPSASASATTAKLVSDDLTPKLIDAAQFVQDGTVNVAQLNVAAFSDQSIPNGNFEGGFTAGVPNTWYQTNTYIGTGNTNPSTASDHGSVPISGSESWRFSVAQGDGRLWRSSIVPLVPTDVYYFAGTIRTNASGLPADSISIGLAYASGGDDASFANITTNIAYPIIPFTGSTTNKKVEGQLTVPAGMGFGALIVKITNTTSSTPVEVVVDDLQLKRIVGTANIANAAINSAQIATLAVDDAKIANLSVGKLTTGTLNADMTVSSRIKTANTGARVELNAAGIQGYDVSGNVVTQVTTDGALISKWFRTNTSGTRIEMGTYSTGAGAANIAFFPDTTTWQFPPNIGFGGAYTSAWIPGVAMQSGSLSATNYGKYGLSQIGLDQVGGIVLTTGNKLDGTESTMGADITIDAGGSTSDINIRGGGASRASILLSSTAGNSLISIPSGGITYNYGGSMSNSLYRSSIAWSGFPADHMVLGAGGGLRVTSYTNTDMTFGVTTNGGLIGNGAWGTVKLIARDQTTYLSFGPDGSIFKNAVNSPLAGKTFVIQHPVEEDKYLVHATVEMPENRVAYEGNSKLEPAPVVLSPGSPNMKDNFIGSNDKEIVLPAYFTALVDESTAVVTVSAYYHDCDDSCDYNGTPSIAATKVKDGKFRVKATGGYYHPDISFAWRVSAVRKDIPELEVEPSKADVTMHGDGPYTYLTKKA